MRHAFELLLGVVDALSYVAGQVFQHVGEVVLLGCSLAGRSSIFCVGRNLAVGVEPLDDALGFVEDARAFFNERLDFINELLFVTLVFGRGLGAVNFLPIMLVRVAGNEIRDALPQ